MLAHEAELMWIEARGTPGEKHAWDFWQAMAAISGQVSRGGASGSDTADPAHRDADARSAHVLLS